MQHMTLVIPCYNEEEALPPLFGQLAALKQACEGKFALDLLFVDDGSADRTPEILQAIPDHLQPARVVTHKPNRGLGAAIATGFAEAPSDLVAMMDADCTYDPLYLVDMIDRMTPGVDIVTGSEFHPLGRVDNISWLRLFLSRNLSRLYRLVFWCKLYSFSCLMRIYRKPILTEIMPNSTGFLSCTEVLLNAHRQGYHIVEFPLVLTERQHGDTKMPIVRTIVDHCWFILRHLFRRRRPRAISVEGRV